MNPISLPLIDGDTLMIDNSSLELFTTCPRSAQYGICRRLKSSGEKVALKFGGIVHRALEARYREATSMLAQSPEVEQVMLAVGTEEYSLWQPPEDDFRNYDMFCRLVREYGIAYPFESFEIVKFPDGRPFVEVPFAVPLGEIDAEVWDLEKQCLVRVRIKILWTGRMDLAYEINNSLYLMDHKTTSVMGPSYFTAFELSNQFYGYAYAAEYLLNVQVSGMVVNAIGVRRPTKTGKSLEFNRQLIPIQRGHIDNWRTNVLHIIADFIEHCRRGYLPMHTFHCVNKFGECPYRKVCILDSDEQREVMLGSGEFETNTWSPLT